MNDETCPLLDKSSVFSCSQTASTNISSAEVKKSYFQIWLKAKDHVFMATRQCRRLGSNSFVLSLWCICEMGEKTSNLQAHLPHQNIFCNVLQLLKGFIHRLHCPKLQGDLKTAIKCVISANQKRAALQTPLQDSFEPRGSWWRSGALFRKRV